MGTPEWQAGLDALDKAFLSFMTEMRLDPRKLFPPQTLRGRIARFPLSFVKEGKIVRVLSGLNRGFFWVAGAGETVSWVGTYESEKQRALGRLVRAGMTAFDIGANVGFYSLALARLVGPTGNVWAFEPAAENLHLLCRHLELNKLKNVTVIASAVGAHSGTAAFAPGPLPSMGKLDARGSVRVPVVSLDVLIREGRLPIPDVIKVDIEGAEVQLLKGAKDLLSIRRTTWLIALHGKSVAEQVRVLLEEYGFQIKLLDGTVVGIGQPLTSDEIIALPHEQALMARE